MEKQCKECGAAFVGSPAALYCGNCRDAVERKHRTQRQLKSDKRNTRQITLKLSNNTDADILARLGTEANKQGYIKALIRADISGR